MIELEVARRQRRFTVVVVVSVVLLHLLAVYAYKVGFPTTARRHLSEIKILLGVSPAVNGGSKGEQAPLSAAKTTTATTRAPSTVPTEKTTPAPKAAEQSTSAATASAGGQEAVPMSDSDIRAAYLNNPKPPYPPMAYQMRSEGTVVLKALVLPDGSCGEVLLARSSGNEQLDQSALRTVAKWKFTPAQKQGEAHAQWVSFPITFKIRQK